MDSKTYLKKLLTIKTVWSEADVKRWKKGRKDAEKRVKNLWQEK